MSLVNWKRRAEAVTIEGEVYENVDLRSMKAFGSRFTRCTFRNVEFDLTDWRASKFIDCTFLGCGMRLVNFATGMFQDCRFQNCDLEQASFMGSQFEDVEFENCRMAYGELMFQDATVRHGLFFRRCNLHGSNLDFREVKPREMTFEHCNLWGAKVSMGCALFNAHFDNRATRQFLALVARASQDSTIARMAGDEYEVVCRAMDWGRECRDTTTSRATTSTPILSFPDQTASTANVASPQKTGT